MSIKSLLNLWIFSKVFFSNGELEVPWKWVSVDPKLYFEKQIDSPLRWINYLDNIIWRNYSQISFEYDENGNPIVTLKEEKKDNGLIVKLAQYIFITQLNSRPFTIEGFWIHKDYDLRTPWRWQCDQYDIYIERRQRSHSNFSDEWGYFLNGSLVYNLTQVEFISDANGYPIVVMYLRKEEYFIIKLTEGMSYFGENLASVNNEYYSGYWGKKQKVALKNTTHMIKPLRWQSDLDQFWYFEKQKKSNIWLQYGQGKVWARFTQVSGLDVDASGGVLVILSKTDGSYSIKLSENMVCYWSAWRKCSNNQMTTGFWKNKHDTCKNLPRHCEYIPYWHLPQKTWTQYNIEGIICKNFDYTMINDFVTTWNGCPFLKLAHIFLTIKSLSQANIIDNSILVFNLTKHLPKLRFPISLAFLETKGFDIDSVINTWMIFDFIFFGDFNLYRSKQLVKDCLDFRFSSSHGFIFVREDDRNFIDNFYFINPNSAYPICSLFFQNARIKIFKLSYIVNSYFRKNKISFTGPNVSRNDLNSIIYKLIIDRCYRINIDSQLLNKEIFKNTQVISLDKHVYSIEAESLRSLTKLGLLFLKPGNFLELIRKQGIGWIRSINSDLNVNLTNSYDLESNAFRLFSICLSVDRDFIFSSNQHYAYDTDFCLLIDFPFQQLIFVREDEEILDYRTTLPSCSELWLYKFYTQMISVKRDLYYLKTKLDHLNLSTCNFEQKLKLCNKTNFKLKNYIHVFSFDFLIAFEFALIVFSSLFAFYGFIINLTTIYVIFSKSNTKSMRNKQYIYMSNYCLSNALICITQITSLMSECQSPFGIFCSSIKGLKAIQYTKIVFGEYVNSVCRLMSNFFYLGFSICRMAKVGKDHGKLVVFLNNLKVKKYFIFCLILSCGMSVCKTLQFDINFDLPDYAYPVTFIQNPNRQWIKHSGFVAITVINAMYDIINYFFFMVIHLCADIVLIKKMRRILKEKEEKMREIKSQVIEKVKKENKESKRRLILMVVFSSLFNLFTKVPSMIASLNDVRLIVIKPIGNKLYTLLFFNSFSSHFFSFKFFCSSEKSCLLFQKFGNCLFLFSLCSVLSFFKRFDQNFKEAYQQVFKNKESKKSTTQIPQIFQQALSKNN